MADVEKHTKLAPYCKPAKQPGEDNSMYVTRLLISYACYLHAYYTNLNVDSKYLKTFSCLQTMLSIDPGKLRMVYLQLAQYIQNECTHITTYDICCDFVTHATLTSIENQAHKDLVELEHIKKFANIFWIFVKSINNIA